MTDGEVMAAAWPGKVKTATQMLAIIFLLTDMYLRIHLLKQNNKRSLKQLFWAFYFSKKSVRKAKL